MLRIDRETKSFVPLCSSTMSDVAITERNDFQEFIANSPAQFFAELGEELFILRKEFCPSEAVADRIDLLCVDKEGVVVIVELKRGSNKLQLLQAVSYAGMIADWSSDDLLQRIGDIDRDGLTDFLDESLDGINRKQRLILVAEGYDYALLAGAQWLCEQFGVPIRCCGVSLETDGPEGAEYVSCGTVYPPLELAQQAVPRGRQAKSGTSGQKWRDWDHALTSTENPEVVDFFNERLSQGQENRLKYRALHFRIAQKRRLYLKVRRRSATAVQTGRFDSDTDFWRQRLSVPDSIVERGYGGELRFSLTIRSDFDAFRTAVDQDLSAVEWHDDTNGDSEDEEDE